MQLCMSNCVRLKFGVKMFYNITWSFKTFYCAFLLAPVQPSLTRTFSPFDQAPVTLISNCFPSDIGNDIHKTCDSLSTLPFVWFHKHYPTSCSLIFSVEMKSCSWRQVSTTWEVFAGSFSSSCSSAGSLSSSVSSKASSHSARWVSIFLCLFKGVKSLIKVSQ